MTTVREVLVRLGRPPAEICFDWAWQLRQFCRHESQDAPFAHPALDTDLDSFAVWSNFTVDEHGVLSHCDPLATTNHGPKPSVEELIAQLMSWAHASQPPAELYLLDPRVAPTPKRALAPADTGPPVVSTHSVRNEPTNRSNRPTPIKIRRRGKTRTYYRAATVMALVAIAIVIGPWLLALRRPSQPRNSEELNALSESTQKIKSVARGGSTSIATPANLANPGRTSRPDANATEQNSEALSLVNSPLEPSAKPLDPAHPLAFSSLESDLAPTLATVLSGPKAPPHTTPEASSSRDGQPEPDGAQPSAAISSSSPAAPPLAPVIDVVGELASMAKTAEEQSSEQQIPVNSDPSQSTQFPPLVLATTPAQQLQAFDKTIRARQPVWNLRLAVGEGFSAIPSKPQRVEGREWTSWTVREVPTETNKSDFKAAQRSAQTQVLVQAQIVNHRQTALRWRIVAGASDFAGMAIPLDREWLDRAQFALGNLTQGLQAEVERTRVFARVEGLTAETRSGLTTRRRELETQHKLATRCLEIVADTNQLQGWLDGHIEVHAELLDAAQSPSLTLLQFGTP